METVAGTLSDTGAAQQIEEAKTILKKSIAVKGTACLLYFFKNEATAGKKTLRLQVQAEMKLLRQHGITKESLQTEKSNKSVFKPLEHDKSTLSLFSVRWGIDVAKSGDRSDVMSLGTLPLLHALR
eukprot:6490779-Amphidinium_carterae.1